jgi:hypothetical protein
MQQTGDPELEEYYGNMRHYVKMVTGGFSNMLMLDAKGGLGKTHNVKKALSEELSDDQWAHKKGFSTPIELYKTLWKAREHDRVLFLDDMTGLTNNKKALDMLKAATDTEGDENWVEYETSRSIDHPFIDGAELPNQFCFRGSIILSFNDTPDNRHFEALRDRGTYYNLTFDYQERIDIIHEIAKDESFSKLSIEEQRATARWIETATDASYDVTIRSFDEICQMRSYARSEPSADWEAMALEIFDMDIRKHRIIELREAGEMSVEEQIETWSDEFDLGESRYYELLAEIRDERDT